MTRQKIKIPSNIVVTISLSLFSSYPIHSARWGGMAITGIKPVIRIRTASEDGVGQSLSQLIGGTRGLSERE